MNKISIIITKPKHHQEAINKDIEEHKAKGLTFLSIQTNIDPAGYVGHNTYKPNTELISTIVYYGITTT